MALEHILAAIEGDADDAVAAVRREAKRARKQLQASAEEDRIRAIEEVHAAAHQKSEAATRAIAQEGERQLLERRLAWRRQEVESLLEGLAHELAALRHDPPRHEQLSQHLAREALAALPDATVARIDPRDETLLQP
ncbi:MAG: hypothetical protein KC731_43205, partial [Myxococcales bacterium]|nr:hypothetical protein [Myxococcales bacterium]